MERQGGAEGGGKAESEEWKAKRVWEGPQQSEEGERTTEREERDRRWVRNEWVNQWEELEVEKAEWRRWDERWRSERKGKKVGARERRRSQFEEGKRR